MVFLIAPMGRRLAVVEAIYQEASPWKCDLRNGISAGKVAANHHQHPVWSCEQSQHRSLAALSRVSPRQV